MSKKEFIIGAVVLMIIMTLATVFGWEIYLISAVVIAGVYFIYRQFFKGKEEPTKTSSKEPEIKKDGVNMDWQTEVSTEEAYRYLMHSNYRLRVEGPTLKPEDVTEIENLIDDLRNLVLIIEGSPSVLKWKVNQICVDFIPKLVNKFNGASSESRTEIMATTVADIRKRLNEIETVVNNNNQQEFEHYANTLQTIMKA